MGVPKFFRWLADRFPAILVNEDHGGHLAVPLIDNLYLDMNGIIHHCSHSNDGLTIDVSFEDIFHKVCMEIDRLVSGVVKPQKVLYIAVDGVAPRAKLNQQRARRFRSARERQGIFEEQFREGLVSDSTSVFDSNCITPGTEFMAQLSTYIRAYVDAQLCDKWKHLTVFFSGSEVPGEGEHKIIAYIRECREKPDYTPNVRHCIHGADADMLMLSLSTHEPFFAILREVHEFKKKPSKTHPHHQEVEQSKPKRPKLCFVRMNIVRELISRELLEGLPQTPSDIERVIDDFVFLTFLVGNDFLPQLPAMNIGDQAFEVIFDAYKTVLAAENGYLIENGKINFSNLQIILSIMCPTEMTMFVENEEQRERAEHRQHQNQSNSHLNSRGVKQQKQGTTRHQKHGESHGQGCGEALEFDAADTDTADTTSGQNLDSDGEIDYAAAVPATEEPLLPLHQQQQQSKAPSKTYEQYVGQYYQEKLGINMESSAGRDQAMKLVRSYMEGLQWCLSYYFQGCSSWSWFYPYHYSPFINELCTMFPSAATIELPLDAPFTPFQQLLACLPPLSCNLLPTAYHWLFTDQSSPLLDFYPHHFTEDLNGKRQSYEAVIVLPFIDKDRLLSAERDSGTENTLTDSERSRNSFGMYYMYQFDVSSNKVRTSAINPSYAPSAQGGFKPVLVAGTLPFIPTFPRLDQLPASAFFKSSGKNSFMKKPARGAAHKSRNVFAEENEAVSIAPMAMPGTVSSLKEDFTDGKKAGGEGHQADLFALHNNRHIGDARHIGGGGGGARLQLRFLFDESSSIFLSKLADTIHSMFPKFKSQLDRSPRTDAETETGTNTAAAENSDKIGAFSASSVGGLDGLFCLRSTVYISVDSTALLIESILPKSVSIFNRFKLQLLPSCYVDPKTGIVGVKFKALDHFGQIDQFLSSKLHLDVKVASETIFETHLTIGTYSDHHHSHANKFESRLLEELTMMTQSSLIPPLIANSIQLVHTESSYADHRHHQYRTGNQDHYKSRSHKSAEFEFDDALLVELQLRE